MSQETKASPNPEPWTVGEQPTRDGYLMRVVLNARGVSVARLPLWPRGGDVDADARLIAAAPELLEVAAAHARVFCDAECIGRPRAPTPPRDCGTCSVCMARALIARVRGGG